MTGAPNENQAYKLRLEAARRILGKDQEIIKIDEETGEQVVVKKKNLNPISREDAQNLEYKALVSEGGTLYRAKEYRRAIDAFTLAMEKQKEDQNILIDRARAAASPGCQTRTRDPSQSPAPGAGCPPAPACCPP